MYKNIPAVMAKIHCREVSSVDTCTPIMNPIKAVREENKLAIIALQIPIPLFNSTAKSPVEDKVI